MAHVILYGGSFNPPTLAHAGVVKSVIDSGIEFDDLYMVPTFEHAYGKDLAPYGDRVEMCWLALRQAGRCAAVSTLDKVIQSEPRGSMYSFCRQLRDAMPRNRITIVVGQDQAEEIGTRWHNGLALFHVATVLVIPRADKPLDYETYPWLRKCTIGYNIDAALRDVSSTKAREALAAGADTTGLLHPEVAAYCLERGLYGANVTGSAA